MLARPEIPTRTTLNDKFIEKLPLAGQPGSPPGKAEYTVRDDLQPGFYVLVGRRVKSLMAVADGIREGRRRTMKVSVGRPGDPGLTIAKARAKAKAHIAAVQAGSRDPVQRRPKAMTLRAAWAEYKADLRKLGRRESTIEFYERNVNLQLKAIADRPLTDLQKKREMRAWFNGVTAKHGKGSANAAARTLSAIFSFAFKKLDDDNVLTFNPVSALSLHRLGKSKGGMLPEQIPDWGAQYRVMPNRLRAEFHLFTLLSGSRPEVLTRVRIEDVDWRNRTLFLDKPKGKEAGVLPLSRPMMRCIVRAIDAGRIEAAGSAKAAGWLFPSALSKSGRMEAWVENRRKTLSQYGRDLRKTYRTLADRLGIPTEQSKALMLHGAPSEGAHDAYLIDDGRTLAFRAAQDRISAAIVARVFPDGEPRTRQAIEPWEQRRPGRPLGWRKPRPAAEPQPEVADELRI